MVAAGVPLAQLKARIRLQQKFHCELASARWPCDQPGGDTMQRHKPAGSGADYYEALFGPMRLGVWLDSGIYFVG